MSSEQDALAALCRFAQDTVGAQLVVALEVDAGGRAVPVAAAPQPIGRRFSLQPKGFGPGDWNGTPKSAAGFRLPVALLDALDAPVAQLLFLPVPLDHAPASGLLILWTDAPPAGALIADLSLLTPSLSLLFAARRTAQRQMEIRDQFTDLCETVPTGIILVDGDGQRAIVNARAADYLGVDAGTHQAAALVEPMRMLRQRCLNCDELEATFNQLVANVDYAAVTHWDLGDRTLEVDTHPIRGDGERGRVWLLNDITAELRMASELRQLAMSDALTGVPNRRAFEERADQIIGTRLAAGRSVSLLMIDVDHFKSINDNHGHPAGDEVLKTVARRCREALRDRDLFARFGGEEFVALLDTTQSEEVATIAERLRSIIAGTPIPAGGAMLDVHISVGAAAGRQEAEEQGDGTPLLPHLIARADDALYQAKRAGRNRVVIAP